MRPLGIWYLEFDTWNLVLGRPLNYVTRDRAVNSAAPQRVAGLKYQVPNSKSRRMLHETAWNLVLGI